MAKQAQNAWLCHVERSETSLTEILFKVSTKNYFVYILTNKTNKVLYTGITNNLQRRIYEHRSKLVSGFTEKYNLNKLVYFEEFPNVNDAIAAEKKIKGWLRIKKTLLIESKNPNWDDLSLLLSS